MEQVGAQRRAGAFFHGPVSVVAHQRLARDTYLIRLHAPRLARAIRPGQFLMLRLPGTSDPLLGRPFALYDIVPDACNQPAAVDVVYLVVGKLTGQLTKLHAGERVDVWGPLGNGFPDLAGREHVALVAGGIGQTPFLAHVRELLGERGYGGAAPRRQVRRVSFYYGVRSADLAAGVEGFRGAGAEVYLATDDGSLGHRGFVTALLDEQLATMNDPPRHLVGCGPEPMLRALAALARRHGLGCHLSLETPMACGVGICFSCVTPVLTPAGSDFRRVCVEGPVFDAACLDWHSPAP